MVQRNVQVYAAVAEAIKARITSGEWEAGHRLPTIHKLAKEFGVGVGSIREAVRVLESAGLVRIEHGRGMFVDTEAHRQSNPYHHFQDAGTGSVLAHFEARRILEPELAALAAERGSSADLQAIHDLAEEMTRLVAVGEDFLEPDVQFHRRIALAAQNLVLAQMMDGVNDLLLQSRKLTSRVPGMSQRAAQYHLLIADAIRSRNSLQARLLMLAHVNDALDTLIDLQNLAEEYDTRSTTLSTTSTVVLAQRSLIPRS